MAERRVLIERASDGAQYAVEPKDFEKEADGEYKGFKVLRYEDGQPYEGPKTARAIAKAQEPAEATEQPADAKKGEK